MKRAKKRACALGLLAAAALGCAETRATEYMVTFDVTAELQNVFVWGYEFNGHVYAWDLFPLRIGTVPVGRTSYGLGSHDLRAWAIAGTNASDGVMAGINDSLSSLPDGLPFGTVFPGYSQSVVRSNLVALNPNGAYNTQPAFALFDWVLTNEDTLKTDLATGTLHIYTFSNGVNVGSATIAVAVTGACCAADGSCASVTAGACGGVWTAGVCAPNPCPQPAGACCNGTQCLVIAASGCAGIYQGDGTVCGAAGNPTMCCPANFNGVSGVSVQDIFDFLTAYFAADPAADFNLSGAVSVQDIFDFLSAYFAGCP